MCFDMYIFSMHVFSYMYVFRYVQVMCLRGLVSSILLYSYKAGSELMKATSSDHAAQPPSVHIGLMKPSPQATYLPLSPRSLVADWAVDGERRRGGEDEGLFKANQ
jgi:hypothetical protein